MTSPRQKKNRQSPDGPQRLRCGLNYSQRTPWVQQRMRTTQMTHALVFNNHKQLVRFYRDAFDAVSAVKDMHEIKFIDTYDGAMDPHMMLHLCTESFSGRRDWDIRIGALSTNKTRAATVALNHR